VVLTWIGTAIALGARWHLGQYWSARITLKEGHKPAADYVRRLREVLSGEDKSPEFAHLSGPDRAAILEILSQTKPDFVR